MTRQQLKMLRLYTGLTQVEFAKTIGIAPGTVAKMEADLMDISTANKAKILRIYDLLDDGFFSVLSTYERIETTERVSNRTLIKGKG